MALSPGTSIGHYDVTSLLGEGGMGQVWQATDTQLNRQVALKILPDAFADDPDRLARFTREAQILASLNHPNIAQIHGIEEADGTRALVLELVEGPTLADRISEGPIPLDEALPIAKQIAEALEAAHEAGVIHRDLKPANIKVREDGTVKVLDFGLAKALDPAPDVDPSQSPTLTAAATQMGVILGTAAYMSPEQARGKPVDKRTDIWAFGCVLYEMLAGTRPFQGDDVSITLSAVLQREPDWSELPSSISDGLLTCLRRCVQKDPRERIQAIGDVRLALSGAFDSARTEAASPVRIWQRRLPIGGGFLGGAAVAALVFLGQTGGGPATSSVSRLSVPLPEEARNSVVFTWYANSMIAISPEGDQLVFIGGEEERLHQRSMASLEIRPLEGTEGARNPFFSSDGRSVAFFTRVGELKVVSLDEGRQPLTIARGISSSAWASGTWVDDGSIVFSTFNSGLITVSEDEGIVRPLTTPEDETQNSPQFVREANAVLFYAQRGDATEIQALSLDQPGAVPTTVLNNASHPYYVSSGHLLFVRDGALLGIGFDTTTLRTIGAPVSIPLDVAFDDPRANDPVPQLAVSATGTVAYARAGGAPNWQSELVWVDKDGAVDVIDTLPMRRPNLQLSPDEDRVLMEYRDGADVVLRIYDMARGVLGPVLQTKKQTYIGMSLWVPPNGANIVSSHFRTSQSEIRSMSLGRASPLATLVDTPGTWLIPGSFSVDGKSLVYSLFRPQTGSDIDVIEFDDDLDNGEVTRFLETTANEQDPAFSPDGDWIAFVIHEPEGAAVWMTSYPSRSDTIRVSPERGREPLWSPDGTELYYQQNGGEQLWKVRVETEPEVTIGDPELIVQGPFLASASSGRSYDITDDGERFLMVRLDPEARVVDELVVVQNWTSELDQLIPLD